VCHVCFGMCARCWSVSLMAPQQHTVPRRNTLLQHATLHHTATQGTAARCNIHRERALSLVLCVIGCARGARVCFCWSLVLRTALRGMSFVYLCIVFEVQPSLCRCVRLGRFVQRARTHIHTHTHLRAVSRPTATHFTTPQHTTVTRHTAPHCSTRYRKRKLSLSSG